MFFGAEVGRKPLAVLLRGPHHGLSGGAPSAEDRDHGVVRAAKAQHVGVVPEHIARREPPRRSGSSVGAEFALTSQGLLSLGRPNTKLILRPVATINGHGDEFPMNVRIASDKLTGVLRRLPVIHELMS